MKLKKAFIVILILLFTGSAFAAGTVIRTSDVMRVGTSGKDETRIITIVFTADASAHTIPNTALCDIPDVSGVTTCYTSGRKLDGWWLWKLDYVYGATGAGGDADLYIWTTLDKIDLLGGQGVDKITNATNSTIYPSTCSQALTGTEIFDIDNIVTNSATGTIKLYLYR